MSVETSPDSVASPVARARVLVLALNYRVTDRIVGYVGYLVTEGVDVDLVVAERTSTRDVELDPRVRVHPVAGVEHREGLHRVANLLIFRIPGGVIARARRLTRARPLRPVDKVLEWAERGHSKLGRAVHRRVFLPLYRGMRPWLVARRARRVVSGLDAGSAGKIVAADLSAVTLGWKLARRHPGIPATTSIERTTDDIVPQARTAGLKRPG